MTTIALFCAFLASGEFANVGPQFNRCQVPEYHQVPLYLSYYDPALCDIAPTNCDGDPTTLATGSMHDNLYGFGLACPYEWLGREYTTWLYVPELWTARPCLDTGGNITMQWRALWQMDEDGYWHLTPQWAVVIDLLEHTPPSYVYTVVDVGEWHLKTAVNPLRVGDRGGAAMEIEP